MRVPEPLANAFSGELRSEGNTIQGYLLRVIENKVKKAELSRS